MKIILFTLLSFSSLFCSPLTWTTPTTLSALGQNAFNPQVGMDSSGNSVAGWIQSGFFRSATKLAAGSWSAATTVSLSGTTVMRLAVDPAGNATAIWNESGTLKASNLPLGGTWAAATTLGTGVSAPQLAIDSSGNAVAIWVSGGMVLSKTRLFGGSWSALPDTLAAAGDSAQVAIGSNGTVVAVWHNTVSAVETIFAATKTIALGIWSAGTTISSANLNSIMPNIAVDSNGNALAIWFKSVPFQLPGGKILNFSNVQASSLPLNGSWSTPVDISDPGIFNAQALVSRISYDALGNAIVMWTISFDGNNFDIGANVLSAKGNWREPRYLVGANPYCYYFDLATLSNGYSYIAFMMLDSISNSINIQANKTEIDSLLQIAWYFPATISTGSINGFPSIAASLTGSSVNTAAAWINFNGSNRIIQVATGTGSIVQPPTGLSVMQNTVNNGLFTETTNTITWVASTTPTVSSYLIFRNGRFIKEVDFSVLQYTDRNRNATSVTYSVAAVDSDHSQSATADITFP